MTSTGKSKVPPPLVRPLRVFAFDPSFAWQPELAVLNETVLEVPWEELRPGPVGEYLEIVDVDPASGCCYEPVDLDHPYILAQGGLPPSESSPQFHQQMVYAVVVKTIQSFERGLGRRVLWADGGPEGKGERVPRLRILPHGVRWQNASYDPAKKAIAFGYFPASETDSGCNLPGGMIFTCLSHDVVVHETTHALLDGLHPHYQESSNVDSLALHEGFADLVALLQRFSNAHAVRHEIAATSGDLADANVLSRIAFQWGMATGRRGALRDSLGAFDAASGSWQPHQPSPADLARASEPHDRGAILVAAVFDAFVSIYKARVADLLRLGGRDREGDGALHPDLAERLASEASKVAAHVLTMCIRALDYCPPVDVDFGDFLRALITADRDLVPDDERRYRVAMIEAFRRRGIHPRAVASLAESSIAWRAPSAAEEEGIRALIPAREELRRLYPMAGLDVDRAAAWSAMRASSEALHEAIGARAAAGVLSDRALGLALDPSTAPRSIGRDVHGNPKFEVSSMRPACRLGPDGAVRTELVIELTQERRGFVDVAMQERADAGEEPPDEPDFLFRGGTTILIDLEGGRVRYNLVKRIDDPLRLDAQRRYLTGEAPRPLRATYFRAGSS